MGLGWVGLGWGGPAWDEMGGAGMGGAGMWMVWDGWGRHGMEWYEKRRKRRSLKSHEGAESQLPGTDSKRRIKQELNALNRDCFNCQWISMASRMALDRAIDGT